MREYGTRSRIWKHACWLWILAAAPAAALQILEATDHAELSAEVSSSAVNRIALQGDRIERVVQSSGAFTVEHDPVRGDLYLYPAGGSAPGGTTVVGGAQALTLYVGTERGFTYRLSLTAVARDSAQILIRNRMSARTSADRGVATVGGHEYDLVALVRAVATRSPPPGYVIVPVPNVGDSAGNSDDTALDVSLVELWRGPRFTARVLSVRAGADVSASVLAESYGPGAVAAWLEPDPKSGGFGDYRATGDTEGMSALGLRLAVVVEESAVAEDAP